ncbi:hypothetical protein [Algisphaera agarilytica]|uniref:Uncharacterized protein n=1 Tax=Algisphaera agarilytica TaxID=1385975 RepID=A0A7X0H331_9BACT|nr:hypothetical protein [Algisphaera agarilytica]MBB6428366.1 hypothetical protein [Algisphaera agarilytica]
MSDATTQPATPHSFWLRVAFQPASLEYAVLYLLAGTILIIASDATVPASWSIFIGSSMVFSAWYLAARLGVFFFVAVRKKSNVFSYLPNWLVAILPLVLMLTASTTDLDLKVRLWLCQSSIQKDAEWIMDLQEHQQLYFVENSGLRTTGFWSLFTGTVFHADSKSVWYKTSRGDWLVGRGSIFGGIIYSPDNEPHLPGDLAWNHLYGPWWVWRCTD